MTMTHSRAVFSPVQLDEGEVALVGEVRRFARSAPFPPSSASPTRGGFSRTFSEQIADRGWVGMTIPREYGGTDRTGVERCLVISELLSAGAPLGAHWAADRQTAPSLLKNGPETLRRELLPMIAGGRCLMAGGFSEPDAGSDLAAVCTRAVKVDGGWRITGRKIWTTDADQADFIEVLCRTEDAPKKHQGLSIIIVPMDAPGIEVSPIEGMDGERHFNEVVLEDVFAPDDWLVGIPGTGWEQLTAELALERAGPERYLTTFPLFDAFVRSRALSPDPERSWELIGDIVAQQMGLREMTLAIARLVDNGGSPVAEAAMAKDLGTALEQVLVDQLWEFANEPLQDGPEATRFREFLEINRLRSAVFTTAGGTNEVLRMLVARQLDGWAAHRRSLTVSSDIARTVAERAQEIAKDGEVSVPRGAADPYSIALTKRLREAGFLGVSISERKGGSGGTVDDALEVLAAAAFEGMSVPVVEGPLAAGWLLAEAGIGFDWSEQLAVLAGHQSTRPGGVADAHWVAESDAVVTARVHEGQVVVTLWSASSEAILPGADLAGEPLVRGFSTDGREHLQVGMIRRSASKVLAELDTRTTLARAVALSAAIQRTAQLTIEYAAQRQQFGQPVAHFQAVQTHLALIASEAERVGVLVAKARLLLRDGDPKDAKASAIAARVLAGRAAISVARAAHQVHGAIGVTMEYPLQRFTKRLYEWSLREEPTSSWAARLGQWACAHQQGPWALITGITT
ncbi:acyl-CoA dehydrogenase family protein [Dactylosporangium sp. NPDC051485]|uniref:acyl-CoA dehydrogenase family protein n=1 Tax=Dactylosporangium sp. NPDC051485 TaxID=3154846 RepID=UPI003413776C